MSRSRGEGEWQTTTTQMGPSYNRVIYHDIDEKCVESSTRVRAEIPRWSRSSGRTPANPPTRTGRSGDPPRQNSNHCSGYPPILSLVCIQAAVRAGLRRRYADPTIVPNPVPWLLLLSRQR